MKRLKAYLGLGILLALLIAGLIITAYLLIWGALIGAAIFCFVLLREKIFGKKTVNKSEDATFSGYQEKHIGQVYEHEDDSKTKDPNDKA